ncbi:MAG: PIN domain-containing protein [Desulfomonilaceae bacterium]
MRVLFLDTNIFLQCKDVDQLPWSEVAGKAGEILLLIPTSVEKEIDNLKQDGNSRRTKRARKANSRMREILKAKDEKLTLRKSGPLVEISFVSLDIAQNLQGQIDTSKPDNRIVAEAISYKHEHPTNDVFLLTNDTLLIRTAMRHNLSYLEIPSNWVLEPEPDPNEKKIKELEDKLKKLEKILPKIDITISDSEGTVLPQSHNIVVKTCKELDCYEIEELIAAAKNEWLLHSESEIQKNAKAVHQFAPSFLGFDHDYERPNGQDIQNYFEECDKWISELEAFIKELPTRMDSTSRNFRLVVTIANFGSVPAENVVVEFKLPNGLLFRPPSESVDFDISKLVPKCPQPPEGRWIRRLNPITRFSSYPKFEPILGRIEPIQNTTLRSGPKV